MEAMDPTAHTHHDIYICDGICRAVVSLEEFERGKTVCKTEGCDRNGNPLTPGVRCDHCGKTRTLAEQTEHHAQHHATV